MYVSEMIELFCENDCTEERCPNEISRKNFVKTKQRPIFRENKDKNGDLTKKSKVSKNPR